MKRPDASMGLLSDVAAEAMEPEYFTTTSPRRSPGLLAVGMVLVAALLVLAAVSATRSRGEMADERKDLEARIAAEQQRRDDLSASVVELDNEISRLRQAVVGDPNARAELQELELVTGASPVTGPGIMIEANDAANAVGGKGLIYDSDLTRLVNGLREAGAEAIAINGHRITILTPIRIAGSAITVDYVSLKPPYEIKAIGDPQMLLKRFSSTSAAKWWSSMEENYGIRYEVRQPLGNLTLAADPAMAVRHAKR
jgi:hypothetical protein